MNYEKKYDEALERARKLKGNPQSVFNEYSPKEGDTICDYIFPELKESEDEKIRKEIIAHCRNTRCVTEEGAERIAKWIAWLEKQGEQKPADKVKTKFKKGDLVVDNCGYVWKIEGILNQFYILEGIEGGESRPTIEWVNKTFHLWTIADAKDGDVVVDKSDGAIGIFQGILHHHNGSSCNNSSYCFLYCRYNGFFYAYLEHGNTTGSDDLIPATKKQRDLLFQKMKESGYEWDADKKELKKIEQKTAWSEEEDDDAWMNDIISKVENNLQLNKAEIDWIKLLKERYFWKPSDEQMVVLELASKYERVFTPKQIDILIGLKEQLKKLKGE